MVYYVCVFVTSSTFLAYVIYNRAWDSEHTILSNQFHVAPWIPGQNASILQDMHAKIEDLPYCTAPEDFWYDWTPEHVYRPEGCMWPCLAEERYFNNSQPRVPCTTQADLQDIVGDSVFITSLRLAKNMDAFGFTQRTALFSPFVESTQVMFSFSVTTTVPFWHPLQISSRTITGHTSLNIITVVIDSQGRVDSVYDVSPVLSVTQILKLSGLPGEYLDQPLFAHTKNTNVTQTRRYPVARVVGTVITAQIHCTESRYEDLGKFVEDLNTIRVSLWCTLRFTRLNPRHWGFQVRSQSHGIGPTQRTRFTEDLGLKIMFSTSGTVSYTNLRELFTMIASIIVFMGLQKRFMAFLMKYCLGRVSTIYQRFLYREVSIPNALVGNLINVLMYGGRFKTIARLSKAKETEIRPLFKAELDQLMREHSWSGEIDTDAIAYFLSQTLKNYKKSSIARLRRILGVKKASATEQSDTGREAIGVDFLLAAADTSELRTFQDVVDMFNVHRKIAPIERLFGPPFFHEALQLDKSDEGTSSSLPTATDCLHDQNNEDGDQALRALSILEVSKRPSAKVHAVSKELSGLGLEQRLEQHRVELEEQIQEMREMMKCILQRLARLEDSSLPSASVTDFENCKNATSDSGNSMQAVETTSCVQKINTQHIADAIESIEDALEQLQEERGVPVFPDIPKFHSKPEQALVEAKEVSATHPPQHASFLLLPSAKKCESTSVPCDRLCDVATNPQSFRHKSPAKCEQRTSSGCAHSPESMRLYIL
eukprot:TRINITY_DN11027_c0_g1_i8.p1 TRINITY_DN11027_c0_g1~~TRINITY_DN11027_c0_g1_i8.p1  ORF type:complete len:804 (+),score=76.67 TRINITY_DN11027_c0_g1_i8:112-2412(+)